MRRLLILAGLLVTVALAISVGPTPALAVTSCTTTCSGAGLFCAPVSSCTSVPGSSITCDGVTTTCSAANSWCACSNQCDANYEACSFGCDPSIPVTCRVCDRVYNRCISNCGAPPPNLSHC